MESCFEEKKQLGQLLGEAKSFRDLAAVHGRHAPTIRIWPNDGRLI